MASVDLLGFGETEYYLNRGHGPVQPFYNAQLAGRSVAGINAGDVLRVFGFLKQRADVIPEQIGAVAIGATGPAILHAAAFEPQLKWLALFETQTNYQSIVLNTFYKVNANSLVAGALTAYDLPDLMGALAPRKFALLGPHNHLDEPAKLAEEKPFLQVAFAAYQAAGSVERIRVLDSNETLAKVVSWCARTDDGL